MTALQFESLRHQISHFVHESRAPLIKRELLKMCDLAVDEKALANALYQMVKADELKQHPAPKGSGQGVKFAYGPGKNKPGAEVPAGGKPAADGGRRTAKGNKPARRAAPKVPDKRHAKFPPNTAMWALRADGAFVLLGTDLEIPKDAARVLVNIVRADWAGALVGLASFIEKLDKGAA